MSSTRVRTHAAADADDAPWQAAALRFLVRTGHLGETLSTGMAARVGDRELVGNLTVILVAELYLAGALRPVEIQGVTGLTSGGVTKAIDRLEAAGLITRSHGTVDRDRRAIVISLTDDGLRMADQLAAGLIDTIEETRTKLRQLADEADAVTDAARRSTGSQGSKATT